MSDGSTVYFLGAGASADADIPLTSGLLTRIQKQIEGKESREGLAQFIKIYGAGKAKQAQRAPIVDLMSFLDACISTGFPPGAAFGIEKLRRIRIELVGELSDLLSAKQKKGRLVKFPEGALDGVGVKNPRIASYFHNFAVLPKTASEEFNASKQRYRQVFEKSVRFEAKTFKKYIQGF